MRILKGNSLIIFYILAFLFPWLIWGTTIAQNHDVLSFHIPQSLAFWIGLTFATYISAFLAGGIPVIRDLLLRLIRWRVQLMMYLAAFTTTGIISAFSIGIYLVWGGTHQVGVSLDPGEIIPSLLFQIFFFGLTEETAWRGFALPRLQKKLNPLVSSLILGLFWGLWHIPLVFIPGSFQSTIPFIGFLLSAIATSIQMTWMFNQSKGSVLITAIFHAATDVTIAFLNVMTGDLRLFWIFITLQWVMAIVLIIHPSSAFLRPVNHLGMSEVVYPPEN